MEELVQDVFINLWNKAVTLDFENSIKSYLFATLRNKVLHELRASMIIAKHARIISQQGIDYREDPSDMIHGKHLEKKFDLIVNGLPPQCRQAFLLSRVEQLSYISIAERMGISVNTVEKHLGKALSIIRRAFKEDGITLILIYSLTFFEYYSCCRGGKIF